MREFQCEDCRERSFEPARGGLEGMMLQCPKCGSQAIFPTGQQSGALYGSTSKVKRPRRGNQISLFGHGGSAEPLQADEQDADNGGRIT